MRAILMVMLAVSALLGCTDRELAESKEQVAQCSRVLAETRQEVQRLRAIEAKSIEALRLEERARTQVQTAVNCDWLVPVCPATVAGPGRELLKQGFVAMPTPAAMLGKLLAVLILLLASALGLFLAWTYAATPALARVESAQETIEGAEREAAAALAKGKQALDAIEKKRMALEDEHQKATTAARQKEQATLERLEEQRAELNRLKEEVSQTTLKLSKLSDERKNIERAIDLARKMKDAGSSL
jgi:predicted RNase H-like nuclease (RuvC/YqgF family)